MRVLSFQSEEVLNNILQQGFHKAEPSKSRERRNYTLDIEQLGGENPIWCFAPTKENSFFEHDFSNGSTLDLFRCEMSLRQGGLAKYIMLEMEIPEDKLFTGLAHNGYSGAKVTSAFMKEDLCAVYSIKHEYHWFYVTVTPVHKYRGDILFPEYFVTGEGKVDMDF